MQARRKLPHKLPLKLLRQPLFTTIANRCYSSTQFSPNFRFSGNFQMSTAFFASPGILAPLQSLFRWFAAGALTARRTVKDATLARQPIEQQAVAIKNISNYSITTREKGKIGLPPCAARSLRGQSTGSETPVAPLCSVVRVMRVLEAGQAPASVGRMVISGRMADVCAELDRLVAREAALH